LESENGEMVSLHNQNDGIKFPFKVILMDYVSRFSILEIPKNPRKIFKITKKGNFDGLYKQVR
jgi:hypothetical protein